MKIELNSKISPEQSLEDIDSLIKELQDIINSDTQNNLTKLRNWENNLNSNIRNIFLNDKEILNHLYEKNIDGFEYKHIEEATIGQEPVSFEDNLNKSEINEQILEDQKKKLYRIRAKIINRKKDNKFITYDYKYPLGILKIKNQDIGFKGRISTVLNFFYVYSGIDQYKDYRDFENYSVCEIKSSEFRKKIEAINKRVEKETGGYIKSIIEKEKNKKSTHTNRYRWRIET